MLQPDTSPKGRIIVIDDEPSVRKLIKRLLERKGYSIDTAKSGEEGIAKILETEYDIVITDMLLPGMDGMAVLETIKEHSSSIDVVLITGFGSIESAVSFMKAGALDYITKPINSDHLEIVIQKAIERKELIKAARERDLYFKMSLTDSLTGLFNHKYFQEQVQRMVLHARRKTHNLSIILIDIDDFKLVNDNFGHQTGDLVLQVISSSILKACRSHDTVARYGGEEFGVILPETDADKAVAVAKRIQETIFAHHFKNVTYPVTVSIGVAVYPANGHEAADLIHNADVALYVSKRAGKNRYTLYGEDAQKKC
ncbi:MAG: diguanylate cyclase [Spirochaetes bacterium]|nr:MAG: diguanylate cyclase [Spirochaetota bacterium]